MKRYERSIYVDVLAVVGFILTFIVACRIFLNGDNKSFDYRTILVGLIGGAFIVLVCWNILQTLNLKKEIQKVNRHREQLDEELKCIHEKNEFNQAKLYGVLCQNASFHLTHDDVVIKYQMLKDGVEGLKTLSRLPDSKNDMDVLIGILAIGVNNSQNIHLDEHCKAELFLACGEITNSEARRHVERLINLINRS